MPSAGGYADPDKWNAGTKSLTFEARALSEGNSCGQKVRVFVRLTVAPIGGTAGKVALDGAVGAQTSVITLHFRFVSTKEEGQR